MDTQVTCHRWPSTSMSACTTAPSCIRGRDQPSEPSAVLSVCDDNETRLCVATAGHSPPRLPAPLRHPACMVEISLVGPVRSCSSVAMWDRGNDRGCHFCLATSMFACTTAPSFAQMIRLCTPYLSHYWRWQATAARHLHPLPTHVPACSGMHFRLHNQNALHPRSHLYG